MKKIKFDAYGITETLNFNGMYKHPTKKEIQVFNVERNKNVKKYPIYFVSLLEEDLIELVDTLGEKITPERIKHNRFAVAEWNFV